MPEHLFEHLTTMARLHAANAYDRMTGDFQAITGRGAESVEHFMAGMPACSIRSLDEDCSIPLFV